MSAERRLRITAARSVNRGNLIAVIDVQFGGLEIRDLTILHEVNGLFVGMPRKARVDQVGRQMRGGDGKLLFGGPLVRWVDSGTAQKFQQTCLAVLRRDYPGIVNGSLDGDLRPPLPLPVPRRRRPIPRADSPPPLPDDPVEDLWTERRWAEP